MCLHGSAESQPPTHVAFLITTSCHHAAGLHWHDPRAPAARLALPLAQARSSHLEKARQRRRAPCPAIGSLPGTTTASSLLAMLSTAAAASDGLIQVRAALGDCTDVACDGW